uniref:Uncharacterized protein n=1 Tax=Anguilla anguilla TaxID=7936 RepID=A0A0E9T1P5_ANGAN
MLSYCVMTTQCQKWCKM